MTDFLKTLRALDVKATPGPLSTPHLTDHAAGACRCGYLFAWEGGEYCVATVHKESDAKDAGMGEYPPEDQAAANGALLVLLRNSAARLAAVVEAAGRMMRAYDRYVGTGEFVGGLYPEAGDLAVALAALEAP